jgi:ferredoxin
VNSSALEIVVDRSACRGSGVCVRRAPATFAFDAERKATVADPPGDAEEALLDAERSCPNFAIRVTRCAGAAL